MPKNENVGVALALVFGAGASTAVGAAVVFFPSLVKRTSRRVLAASLGFSAGVMGYVSFVEIFAKSTGSFEDAGFDKSDAYVYSTLCFFGGVIAMILLNGVVSKLLGGHDHHHHHDPTGVIPPQDAQEPKNDASAGPGCPCHSDDPVQQLERMQQMAEEIENRSKDGNEESKDAEDDDVQVESDEVVAQKGKESEDGELEGQQRLVHMGTNTAVAIGLHNFPEGLATFVAALADPTVGSVLAFAIAIHNIPEGLCVALPIYYATGNRVKAFLWALLSGASEFVAALLGWAVLANSFSDTLYAVLFGSVAGMMVIISVRELLPTAHFYDPEDTVVTNSFIAGMALMAVSLVMFVV